MQTKISDFSDVIYTANKNEIKIMWFGRNTKELDSFPPEKWKLLLFIVSFIHKKELDFAKYNYNFLKI